MSNADQLSTWSTSDEIDYLNNIGTHGNFRPEQRLELLQGYRDALKFRPKSEKYLNFRLISRKVQELIDGIS